ncbi:UNVERIFIED_CONTAM: Two-component response regulator ORR26 [Sesamum latifolium]|uniref:Two-component response regulator ORR26 n=1 Tax=Sesamum latifolium TaxID=2727402 RepID=A0AAW2UE32_9LAMI
MWDLGNLSAPTASYLTVMHEIHVLLVDHDSEGLVNIGNQLEACHYRVTLVELASAAITMLLNGKVKFDLVMANINSPDLHGFKLLQQAVNMDIPVVLMSVDDNVFMAMRAIENGAFLFIKKPTSMEVLSGLWQHVIRDKTRAMRERERSCVAANYNVRGIEFRDVAPHHDPEENPNHMYGVMMNDKGKGKKKINLRGNYDEYDVDDHMIMNNKVKRKVCTEWTQDLHEKFMEAVEQLGEGRCFPKEILELMNVPGLTRMQVASHLQKCRNDNWRSPGERKTHNLAIQPVSSDTDGQRPRRFGSMPRLSRASSYRVHGHEGSGVGESSKTNSPTEMPNGTGGDGVDQNMEISGPIMPNASYHQHYGTLIPHPSTLPGTNPSNPIHQSDQDLFNFADMDRLIQNFPGFPQGPLAGMNNPGSSSGGYHFDTVYHHGYDQNNVGPSADTAGSQWSSGTSNFGSDDYPFMQHVTRSMAWSMRYCREFHGRFVFEDDDLKLISHSNSSSTIDVGHVAATSAPQTSAWDGHMRHCRKLQGFVFEEALGKRRRGLEINKLLRIFICDQYRMHGIIISSSDEGLGTNT